MNNSEKLRALRLQSNYDLVIIGGGIQGCAMFWEAQGRGLRTLLIEERDYCSQTSANSLKTIHGGIRYLQTLNLARTWRSSREPEILLNIAPHLVHQLACLLPTENRLTRSRLAVTVGFEFYNLIKMFSCRSRRLPRARCLSKSQLLSMTDLLDLESVTGAGLWYDAQVQHAERLGQAFVKTAKQAGGDAHNYLQAKFLNKSENQDLTFELTDQLNQQTFQVQARSAIYCTASSTAQNLSQLSTAGFKPAFCMAMNLVVNKKYAEYAIGLQSGFATQASTDSPRLLFSAPWRDSTMYGTWYFKLKPTDECKPIPDVEQINYCLDDINISYPGINLDISDVCLVHTGLLPVNAKRANPEYDLMEDNLIQQPDENLKLFSVIPTKYTTCRATAEKMVDILGDKFKMPVTQSISARTPLTGGQTGADFCAYLSKCQDQYRHMLPGNVIEQLCVSYGSQIEEIIQLCETDKKLTELIPGSTTHIKAQLNYELNDGSVFKPGDFIHRRSFLGSDKELNRQTLLYCCEKINRFYSIRPDTEKQVNELLNITLC